MSRAIALHEQRFVHTLPISLGIALGCLAPVAGTLLECWRRWHSVSFASAWRVQETTPLLWMIDLAPLVFCVIGAVVVRHRRRESAMESLILALEQSSEGVAVLDAEGSFLFINGAYARTTGYRPGELIGSAWTTTVAPRDQASMLADYARMQADGKTVSEVMGMRKDGSAFCNEITMVRKRDAAGQFDGHYCFMREITDRKQVERALLESDARFQAAIEAMHDGFLVQNQQGEIVLSNSSAERILGLAADQMQGRSALDRRWHSITEDGADMPGEQHPAMITLRKGVAKCGAVMGVRKPTGELTWVRVNSSPLYRLGEDRPYAAVVAFADITERKRHAELLQQLAVTDGLTAVKNRCAFEKELEQEFALARREEVPLSLVLVDIDHFKSYNEAFGHPAGDDALKIVARLLQASARVPDSVYRYGGEDFAVLLPSADLEAAIITAERFRAAIAAYSWKQQSVTVSVGVATLLPAMDDPACLTAAAGRALCASKSNGRNCVTHARSVTVSVQAP